MNCGRTVITRTTDMAAPLPTASPIWLTYTSLTLRPIMKPAIVSIDPEVITVAKPSSTAAIIASLFPVSFFSDW